MDSWHRIRTLRDVGRHWLSGAPSCLSVPADPYLARLAHYHGMSPILARLAQEGRLDYGSRDMERALSFQARDQAVRSLYLLGELSWLTRTFTAEGLRHLAFKGPTLSYLAYGDPGLRAMCDLDVLIAQEDIEPAEALLAGRGYRAAERATPGAMHRNWAYHAKYEGPGPGSVELHWRLLPRDLSNRWPDRSPLPHAVLLDLGGVTVPTLAPDDLALYLAIHGAKHGWERLEWLLSFAALGGRLDSWSGIVERASATGNLRCLLLAWMLATELLGAEAPPAIRDRLPADAALDRLAHQVSAGLHRSVPDSPARSHKTTVLRLQDDLRGRARCFAASLVTPAPPDLATLPLPAVLNPLYRVIRPLRLGLVAAWTVLRPGKATSQRRKPGVRLFFRPPVPSAPSRPRRGPFRRASSGYPT